MPELLIMARDNAHDDPEMDRRGCYKRGDVVAVMPDGHGWGFKEGPPRFVRLRVTGVAANKAVERLTDHQDEDDAGLIDEAVPVEKRIPHRRRRWRVDLPALPPAVRTALQTTGSATIAAAVLRSRLIRKRDNAQFTDL